MANGTRQFDRPKKGFIKQEREEYEWKIYNKKINSIYPELRIEMKWKEHDPISRIGITPLRKSLFYEENRSRPQGIYEALGESIVL
jgi:hypothetical protein